jgi:hypothetical protein
MQAIARRTGGLLDLVARYASAQTPDLIRNLTLLLARSAGDPTIDVAPLVWRVVGELRSDDSLSRVNLLDAMASLGVHQRLLTPGEIPPSQLYPFLLDCLGREARVQAGAASVVGWLDAHDDLSRFPPEQVAALRDRLLRLRDTASDDRLKRELEYLDGFLANGC